MVSNVPAPAPFALDVHFDDPVRRAVMTLTRPMLERVLGLHALNVLYRNEAADHDERHFVERALDTLETTYEVSEEDQSSIPAAGPLVVVANHPFGGVDGLILTALLRRVRPDVKLLGNYLLSLIPDLRDTFFFVDPFGGRTSTAKNIAALRAAMRWVTGGGALAVFPAGEVSHFRFGRRAIVDPIWSDTVARFIRRGSAPVLPVYFDGRNSALFHALGLLHPRLRTAMLPRELLNKRHASVSVRVGSLIPYSRLQRFERPAALTEYRRLRTYVLKSRSSDDKRSAMPDSPRESMSRIAPPQAAESLAAEIDRLPADHRLIESGGLVALYGRAHQLPAVLAEIGRLRELAFRRVGEGTGRAADLDRFDEHYLHLFVWRPERRDILGAYRMGPTDEILPSSGPAGLYTSTLFRYEPRLLEQLNPGLELGRSFVRPECQRDYAPLMLLWKAIGRFVAARPRYRMLFGPVSISNDYQSLSKYLLVAFLQASRYWPDLGRLLTPKRPPRLRPARDWDFSLTSTIVRDLDEVDELLREIERDRKSVPTLLRQYLRLNARLLGFNVDPEFGDVLDGLMLVDLTEVDRTILTRYMGEERARAFLAHHRPTRAA